MSNQSVQKVSKTDKATYAKTDARYWAARLFRNIRTFDGVRKEAGTLCIKLEHAGRRETINLRTSNQITAASKAAAVYRMLISRGWDLTLAEYKPKAIPAAPLPASVGDVIREVGETTNFRASTFLAYTQSLRTIAAGIAEIGEQVAVDEDGNVKLDRKKHPIKLSKHDTFCGGREAWRSKVDAVRLDLFTPDQIQRWRIAYIAKVGSAPDAKRRAENSAASLIRNARALFSEKVLQFARPALCLPDPLPFAGVRLEKKSTSRYNSKIDAPKLIAAALEELAGNPDDIETFKLFCLGFMAGLRKSEIDTLTWSQVDFDLGQVRIGATEFFAPKSDESFGVVDIDPELLELLRLWRNGATSKFVVESPLAPKYDSKKYRWYRCKRHFRTLNVWLRSKGVFAQKPLHELRKEVGAILASTEGIFSAKTFLRHAHISTTDAFYADKKKRITAGLGRMLVPEEALSAENELVRPRNIVSPIEIWSSAAARSELTHLNAETA